MRKFVLLLAVVGATVAVALSQAGSAFVMDGGREQPCQQKQREAVFTGGLSRGPSSGMNLRYDGQKVADGLQKRPDGGVSCVSNPVTSPASRRRWLRLPVIRGVVALHDEGQTPCGHVLDLLRTRAADLDRRIRELQNLRSELNRLVARSEGLDPADCDAGRICHLVGPT